MNAAMEECQPLLENARGAIEMDPEQEAEMREQMLEFTECMREQGIDMPDPVFSDDGGFTVQAEAGEGGGSRRRTTSRRRLPGGRRGVRRCRRRDDDLQPTRWRTE